VLIHRNIEIIKTFYPRSGFLAGYQFQGCTRLAVKLDFMVGIIARRCARRGPMNSAATRRCWAR